MKNEAQITSPLDDFIRGIEKLSKRYASEIGSALLDGKEVQALRAVDRAVKKIKTLPRTKGYLFMSCCNSYATESLIQHGAPEKVIEAADPAGPFLACWIEGGDDSIVFTPDDLGQLFVEARILSAHIGQSVDELVIVNEVCFSEVAEYLAAGLRCKSTLRNHGKDFGTVNSAALL